MDSYRGIMESPSTELLASLYPCICKAFTLPLCCANAYTIVASVVVRVISAVSATYQAVSLLVWYHSVLLIVGEDDLRDVRSAVADLIKEWMNLGNSLGVRKTDLDAILSANPHSPSNCLREMLTLWLRQSYAVRHHLHIPPSLPHLLPKI